MEELKKRILQDGTIIDNRILKVDNFLNHGTGICPPVRRLPD